MEFFLRLFLLLLLFLLSEHDLCDQFWRMENQFSAALIPKSDNCCSRDEEKKREHTKCNKAFRVSEMHLLQKFIAQRERKRETKALTSVHLGNASSEATSARLEPRRIIHTDARGFSGGIAHTL